MLKCRLGTESWKPKSFQFLKYIQIHTGDLAELKVLRGWNPKAECRECPIAREAAGLTVCQKLQSCTMLFQCAQSLAALGLHNPLVVLCSADFRTRRKRLTKRSGRHHWQIKSHMYAYIYFTVYIYNLFIYTYVYIYNFTYICIYICIYICTYIYMYMHNMYIYVCTYIHIYIYIHRK